MTRDRDDQNQAIARRLDRHVPQNAQQLQLHACMGTLGQSGGEALELTQTNNYNKICGIRLEWNLLWNTSGFAEHYRRRSH